MKLSMSAFVGVGALAPLGALALLVSMLAPALVRAQATAPAGQAQEPSRILQVEALSGTATVRRAGRDISAQAGYLIFAQEQVALASGGRLSLRLAKHGRIDLAPVGDGAATLLTDKLPFSSWAVDLGTRLRLEAGALRVVWARPGDDAKWPIAVLLGPWGAKLGPGEFLFWRDANQTLACNVFGSLEVSDGGTWKHTIEAGDCLRLDRGPSKQQLVASEWAVLRPHEPSAARSAEAATEAEASGLEAALDAALAKPPAAGRSQAATVVTAPVPAGVAVGPGVVPSPPPPPGEPKRDQPASPLGNTVAAAADVQAPAGSATVPVTASRGAVRPDREVVSPLTSSPGAVSTPPATAEPTLPKSAAAPTAAAKKPAPGPAVRPQAARPASPPPADTSTATAVASLAPIEPAGGPEWIVNVMSVDDLAEAEVHVKKLIGAGYPASLRNETVRGRQSYRIVVSGLGSSEVATRLVELLSTKMGYAAAWALQKR